MNNYVLGVDGGGTKTDAVIATLDLQILSSASNGGVNWERMGITQALDNLEEVVLNAVNQAGIMISDIKSATFAIAGIDWPEDVNLYLPISKRLGIQKFEIINDSFAALYAGSPNLEGIVSIAGTGGKTSGIYAGKRVQTMGMELGEGGGAGQLVGLALEYIAMQYHQTTEPSNLYDLIPKLMNKKPGVNFFQSIAREGLRLDESLAPEIFKLADQGDVGAIYAVKKTALQHAKDVIGIAKQLNLHLEDFTVVRAGGLHTAGCKTFDLEFERHVRNFLPNAILKVLDKAPVLGSVIHAAKELDA